VNGITVGPSLPKLAKSPAVSKPATYFRASGLASDSRALAPRTKPTASAIAVADAPNAEKNSLKSCGIGIAVPGAPDVLFYGNRSKMESLNPVLARADEVIE
jgi:hypothetical protein